ncbi:unnamed protein product [Prunus brigantina]
MRGLWHGSKIVMSLALKRKLCGKWGRMMNRAQICWVLQVREETCSLDVVVLASDEVVSVLGSFRQLDEKLCQTLEKFTKRENGERWKDGARNCKGFRGER